MENPSKIKLFIAIIIIVIVSSVGIIFTSRESKTDMSAVPQVNNVEQEGNILGATTQEEPAIASEKTYKKLTVPEARNLINQNTGNVNFTILDIRTPEEVAAGSIDGAVNIDFYKNFEAEIEKLDKNKTYLIYCRSGNRTGQAMEVFKNLQFNKVYDLEGGYNAWLNS